MGHVIRAGDRAAFKRCRRQWDFAAKIRRNLTPETPFPRFDLTRAIKDALAVYYFPGMWDWNRAIVLPLVRKALDDSFKRQREAYRRDQRLVDEEEEHWWALVVEGRAFLDRYVEWAPSVDRFSPLLVETDAQALVADADDPERGLVVPDAGEVRFSGRVDLMVADEHDRYWLVTHRVVDAPGLSTLAMTLDEEALAFCWAWELLYPGMEVAGTIHNEFLRTPGEEPAEQAAPRWQATPGDHPRGGLRQHEPSGGGREISSLRRMQLHTGGEEPVERMVQQEGQGFRRTRIRRSRAEIADVGRRITREALDMVDPDVGLYPAPSVEHCTACAFVAPCLAMNEGLDPEPLLAAGYRERPAVEFEAGRLGGSAGGVGRGWVIPADRDPDTSG